MQQFKSTSVYDCHIHQLTQIKNRSGNITCIEDCLNVPFLIERVFYIYDIPGGEDRGAHSHKLCHQFIIAGSGSFDIFLDDGINKKTLNLNRPYMGLHIPPGIWAAERSFSSGAICLVLASRKYEESDYIRNYEEFVKYKIGKNDTSIF